MNYSAAEVADMLARIKRNLKKAHGMDMPAINETNVTQGDVIAILDRVLIGTVAPGGKEKKK